MKLDLSKLGAKELKDLAVAVKAERDRRGKKNPANHEAPIWTVPNQALKGERPPPHFLGVRQIGSQGDS